MRGSTVYNRCRSRWSEYIGVIKEDTPNTGCYSTNYSLLYSQTIECANELLSPHLLIVSSS